jgi:terminase small subunit / prophage DNA-packing protein
MTTTMSKVQLADLFGVTTRTITDLAKRDIVVRAGNGYALAASVQGYCAHLRKLATGRGGEADVVSATAHRGRLARAAGRARRVEEAIARRELVAAADVEAEWSGVLRFVRAGMLAVPSRCQQRLPGLTAHDVAEIDLRSARSAD